MSELDLLKTFHTEAHQSIYAFATTLERKYVALLNDLRQSPNAPTHNSRLFTDVLHRVESDLYIETDTLVSDLKRQVLSARANVREGASHQDRSCQTQWNSPSERAKFCKDEKEEHENECIALETRKRGSHQGEVPMVKRLKAEF